MRATRLLPLLALFVLAACESDEVRAQRLREDEALACLPVHLAERRNEYPTPAQVAACDAAHRKTARFLSGR